MFYIYRGWPVIFWKKIKYNSRTIQGFLKYIFLAAIFPYTTKYNDRQAHLKLLLLLACSKIVSILCTYPITFLKQLVKSGI